MPGTLRGCGRGVFGLKSWDPLQRPGKDSSRSREIPKPSNPNPTMQENRPQQAQQQRPSAPGDSAACVPTPPPGKLLLAKHSYKANPNSPIGAELSFQRGDRIRFKRTENEHWWFAGDENGNEGHVPASYMYVPEEAKGLPWLQNQEPEVFEEPEEEKDTQPKIVCKFGAPAEDPNRPKNFKPYKPTYDLKGEKAGSDKFECQVCNRFFNGDIPYRMHLSSKAHKEEVALAEEYARAK